ncbi:MAG: hypothetical protein IRY91_01655 [Gemmatimonadaceae bacterium]|nr:hypothetical protein [Gemmatimonadaceae bacterium]
MHPAIVHFPLVLVFLLPLFAGGALWAIKRGARARRAWAIPVALSAALALSAWVAVQTGEAEEERVEPVVAHQPFETHEEGAELFLVLSGGLLAITAAGLAGGVVGRVARVAATAGTAVLIVMAVRVGHSGGQLVYRYGAASAYTQGQVTGSAPGDRGDDGAVVTQRKAGERAHRSGDDEN